MLEVRDVIVKSDNMLPMGENDVGQVLLGWFRHILVNARGHMAKLGTAFLKARASKTYSGLW